MGRALVRWHIETAYWILQVVRKFGGTRNDPDIDRTSNDQNHLTHNCSVDVHTISLLVVFLANIEIACGSRICTMVPAHLRPCQKHSKTTSGDSSYQQICCYQDSCNQLSSGGSAKGGEKPLPNLEWNNRTAHHITWQLGVGVPWCTHCIASIYPGGPKSLLSRWPSETGAP